MLEFAVKYAKAVDKLTSDHALKLRKYEVDPGEWILAGQLCDVLKVPFHMPRAVTYLQLLTFPRHQVFKDATNYFSKKATSNITAVIPVMDHFDQVLTSTMISAKYSAGIRAAIRIGKQTLNRYYSLTDASEIYRIAMGKS